MAKDRIVLESIETDDGRRCVDIFKRDDGTFGFEEYIREPEDNSGWRPAIHTAGIVYTSEQAARSAAQSYAPWLIQSR